MSDLASWSKLIKEQAEQSRLKDEKELQEMKDKYPDEVARVKGLSNSDLLEHFGSYWATSFYDPRKTQIIQNLAEECKKELLARLERVLTT